MPCYDAQSSIDRDSVTHAALRNSRKLEAMLCAILNELERHGVAHQIVTEASRHGLVDIMSFWAEHKSSDEKRVAQELHRFSKHEQDIIKKLLG